MYHLFIATPEDVIFENEAKDLKAPGTIGYFGVLSNHAPLISTLTSGLLEFTDLSGNRFAYLISGGVLEVDHNKVSVLVDSIKAQNP